MSNLFSKGRGTLKRPKICKPPLPPPIVNGICDLFPGAVTINGVGGSASIEQKVFNPDFPKGDKFFTEENPPDLFPLTLLEIENDGQWHGNTLEVGTATPGVYGLSIDIEFPDGTKCKKPLTVTYVA